MGRCVRKCPNCGLYNVATPHTKLRHSDDLDFDYRWRRHKCLDCGQHWSTYEVPEEVFKVIQKAVRRGTRMECPKCNSSNVNIIDSRPASHNRRRRRYVCNHCKSRFTTYEYLSSVATKFDKETRAAEERRKTLEDIYSKAKEGLE